MNSLNLKMVKDLMQILKIWQNPDSPAQMIVFQSNKSHDGTKRVFCAGGDVVCKD